MRYLSVEEIIFLHDMEIERSGGKLGIFSLELLESSVHRPQTSFGGNNLYHDIFSKVACLIHSLIKNQPFIDGNKRTAIISGMIFLLENGHKLTITQNELVELALSVALNKILIEDMADFLEKHSTKV